ncbi:hypothetical protein [Candidatus Poriferisodalis sp.]|uniref:hypothetical protein n=1 Tax=Candidatus Poriferisodalis sp. TaxID=3101277 RepID=UPI003B019C88
MRLRRRRTAPKAARLNRREIAEMYAADAMTNCLIAVGAAEGATHDSGAVAFAIARRWAAHGRNVLLVDADASGPKLARRLGEANKSVLSPAQRGLPSLMAARQPVTAELLRQHCWNLDVPGTGSLWLLLGPTSTTGAQLAAKWLAQNADDLSAASSDRCMIVDMSPAAIRGEEAPGAFMQAAGAVVLIAPAGAGQSAEAMRVRAVSPDNGTERHVVCLVSDGSAVDGSDDTCDALDMRVVGRLEGVRERLLLRKGLRRRRRKPARLVDEMAARVALLASNGDRDEK